MKHDILTEYVVTQAVIPGTNPPLPLTCRETGQLLNLILTGMVERVFLQNREQFIRTFAS